MRLRIRTTTTIELTIRTTITTNPGVVDYVQPPPRLLRERADEDDNHQRYLPPGLQVLRSR